jgi:hypothetical protein
LEVSLQPLTVLIGPNDTGKSAFLSAIQHLSTSETFNLADYWRLNRRADTEIAGKTLQGDVRERGVEPPFQGSPLAHCELDPTRLYRLPSTGGTDDRRGLRRQSTMELGESGVNMPAMLDYLLRRDRKRLGAIACQPASMGPRSVDRGKQGTILLASQRRGASMGPRSVDRGKNGLTDPPPGLMLLQWGRDQLIAESEPPRSTRACCAALQWGRDQLIAERRPCPLQSQRL